MPPLNLQPFKDQLPIPKTIHVPLNAGPQALTINLRQKNVKLHADLPSTPVWSYDHKPPQEDWLTADSLLGPTIEVQRDTRLRIQWRDQLADGGPLHMPFRAVRKETDDPADSTQNSPGQDNAPDQEGFNALEPWTVTHLHGGRTAAMYDGWTENAALSGQSQVSVYENNQPATTLWYHDHAMGITRYNVYAGLAGLYVITESAEEAERLHGLGVLPDKEHTIPLVLMDRNLETNDADTDWTGRMLHKITADTAEFFGPYTLVNGKIWPRLTVRRRRYRFRLLNASNARTCCLRWVALDTAGQNVDLDRGMMQDIQGAIWQIGSDGGLLRHPVTLPEDGLTLSPAERADLVVDFARLDEGAWKGVKYLGLVNTALAPFQGQTAASDQVGVENRPGRLPYPMVMRFDLEDGPAHDPTKPLDFHMLLSPDVTHQPLTHHDLDEIHTHRVVALVESPVGMLMMYELGCPQPNGTLSSIKTFDGLAALGQPPLIVPSKIQGEEGKGHVLYLRISETIGGTKTVQEYPVVARQFDDRLNWHVTYGEQEVWKILNLTTDTHPFHVHLVQFQLLERNRLNLKAWDQAAGEMDGSGDAIVVIPNQAVGATDPPPMVDWNECGLKDTVRVNPGTMVSIAARFDGFTGRYMYHCHVIEHEDHDMMRPFVVVPGPVMDIPGMGDMMPDMACHGHHHGMPGMPGMQDSGSH